MRILTRVPSLTLLINPLSMPQTQHFLSASGGVFISMVMKTCRSLWSCGLYLVAKKDVPFGVCLRIVQWLLAFLQLCAVPHLRITRGCPRQPVAPWMCSMDGLNQRLRCWQMKPNLLAGQLSLSLALADCMNLGFNPGVESHPLFTFCSCSRPVPPEPGISSDSSCTAQAGIELQAHTHWQGHRRRNNLHMGLRFGKTYCLSGGSRLLF